MQTDSKKSKSSARFHQNEFQNENNILTCLRVYTSVISELYQFEHFLYEKPLNLPRQIFRHFRSIREGLETIFSALEGYNSFSQDFIEEKDRILLEQINFMESQMNSSNGKVFLESKIPKRKFENVYTNEQRHQSYEQFDSKEINILKEEIENLRNQLRANDQEYEIQIKKYNLKFEDLQDQIEFYKEKLRDVDVYQKMIEKLEIEIRIMKEGKESDEQLITNMSKKIKNLEIEVNGRKVFLSPSRVQQSFVSPSRLNIHYSPIVNRKKIQ